jgi:hypothetical protein
MKTIIIDGRDMRTAADLIAMARGTQKQAKETTADLPGLSFAETFTLTATPEGRGKKSESGSFVTFVPLSPGLGARFAGRIIAPFAPHARTRAGLIARTMCALGMG